jgi:hypothetical protein
VLICLGEHISCFKAICVRRPRHQRSPSVSANPPRQSLMRCNRSQGAAVNDKKYKP